MTNSAESPCLKLCVLDDVRGHCLGCGRTREEIGAWLSLSEEERRAVNLRAKARLAAPSSAPPARA